MIFGRITSCIWGSASFVGSGSGVSVTPSRQLHSVSTGYAEGLSICPTQFLHEQLASASPDLLRSMLTTFINTLMPAEADAVCGADYRESSPDRTNTRTELIASDASAA
jgi:hypothetical protein